MQEWQEKMEQQVEHLKEEVKQLREQVTEPMKVTRIELDPGGIQNRLDNHAEMMKEQDEVLTRIYTDVGKANTEIAVLKGSMEGAKADIKAIRASQSDFKERLEEHGKRLAATATKDDLTAMQGQIKQDTGTIETRLDRMESDVTSIKATQEQILQLLQQKDK